MDDKSRQGTRMARLAATAALAAAMVAACGGGGSADPAAGALAAAVAEPAAQTPAAALFAGADTAVATDTSEASTATALAKKNTSNPAPKTVAQPANTAGRLLASNCFQCHGTLGTGGFDSIRGKEASEVLEFMTKTASKDIMAAHAQGYTPAQLQKIIAYLQQ